MKIKLKNRYGDDVVFVQLEKNKWVFRVDNELPWGMSMNSEGNLHSLDPSGGPYVRLGQLIPETEEEIVRMAFEPYFMDGHGFEYFGYVIYTK
jgi:hypothetical protein